MQLRAHSGQPHPNYALLWLVGLDPLIVSFLLLKALTAAMKLRT